jgi:uncharacterized membrane protein
VTDLQTRFSKFPSQAAANVFGLNPYCTSREHPLSHILLVQHLHSLYILPSPHATPWPVHHPWNVFTVEIPNIDLELDPVRGHTFQERQERDSRAIRLGSESPHDTPDKSDVAGLQSRVDRVEDLNNTQQAMITAQQDQITALSARVSDLHLMREGTAATATKQCAGGVTTTADAFCSSDDDCASDSASLCHDCGRAWKEVRTQA